MAKIGVKGLTYAPYSSGGEGSAVVYSTGAQPADYLVRVDVGEEREDVKFYADDHQIDQENALTGATLSLELANLTDDIEKTFLGYKAGTGTELNVTDAEAPFVGVGFYRKERFKGTVAFNAFWFYKMQMAKDSDSTNTKGENVDFQTETLSGNAMGVVVSSGGDTIYYSKSRCTTEAAAISWLKGKAGIS